jgi:hypothetical protein
MKVLATSILIVSVTLATCIAAAANSSDRPSGVEERHWILISDRLGFVLTQKAATPSGAQSREVLIAPPDGLSAELMPPMKGYFVVKTQAGWRRIVMSEPTDLAH